MRALMLIKQADNGNNNNSGISPLGATGIGLGGVGAGALGMRWHKNKQIGQLNSHMEEFNKNPVKSNLDNMTFSTNSKTPAIDINNSALNKIHAPKLSGFWENVTHIFK